MESFDFLEPSFLPDELLMLRDGLRRFVSSEIIPRADAWEISGFVPREIFSRMGELGYLGMRHEEQYGGSGLGPLASVILAEELSRSGYGGFASSVLVHTDMSVSHISRRGTPEQKQRFLPAVCRGEKIGAICVTEAHAGSDVSAIRTTARREGDSWVINGSKMFITNGANADIYIVAARTHTEAKPSRSLSLFILEKDMPGLQVARKLDKHGWRSSDTAELFFDDVRVPAQNLLGEEGTGFYGIMATFQDERVVVGAMCTGQMARGLELTLDYVRARKAFGKTLWEQQATRQRLANYAAKAAAARSLVYMAAQIHAEGRECVREVSMVKAYTPELAHEVLHGCLQLHGGTGYMTGTHIERMVRDNRVLTIGGGATEVMLEEIAKRI